MIAPWPWSVPQNRAFVPSVYRGSAETPSLPSGEAAAGDDGDAPPEPELRELQRWLDLNA